MWMSGVSPSKGGGTPDEKILSVSPASSLVVAPSVCAPFHAWSNASNEGSALSENEISSDEVCVGVYFGIGLYLAFETSAFWPGATHRGLRFAF